MCRTCELEVARGVRLASQHTHDGSCRFAVEPAPPPADEALALADAILKTIDDGPGDPVFSEREWQRYEIARLIRAAFARTSAPAPPPADSAVGEVSERERAEAILRACGGRFALSEYPERVVDALAVALVRAERREEQLEGDAAYCRTSRFEALKEMDSARARIAELERAAASRAVESEALTADAHGAMDERDAAESKLASIVKLVREHLSATGACEYSDADASLCDRADCTYCALERCPAIHAPAPHTRDAGPSSEAAQ